MSHPEDGLLNSGGILPDDPLASGWGNFRSLMRGAELKGSMGRVSGFIDE